MRSNKKNSVTSKDGKTVYAQGRMWDADKLKDYRDYQHRYIKKYRLFTFRFDQTNQNDLALARFLEDQENLTGYLRDLVTNDMESKDVLMKYRKNAEKELKAIAKNAPSTVKEPAKSKRAPKEKK